MSTVRRPADQVGRWLREYGEELVSFFEPYPDMTGCSGTMTEIVPEKLFVSGRDIVADMTVVQRRGIVSVLNCASKEFSCDTAGTRLRLLELPFEDDGTMGLTLRPLLDVAISFLREGPLPALIVCSAGVSRSVTVSVAYMMIIEMMSLREAFKMMRSRRPFAYPNTEFWMCLMEIDRCIRPTRPSVPMSCIEMHVDCSEDAGVDEWMSDDDQGCAFSASDGLVDDMYSKPDE